MSADDSNEGSHSLGEAARHRDYRSLGPAVALATTLFVAAVSFIVPVFRPDEPQYLDYAWRLWQGSFPEFRDGLTAPIPLDDPRPQFVTHHPPLFPILISPIVGPLVDGGHAVAATLLVRLIHSLAAGLIVWLLYRTVAVWQPSSTAAQLSTSLVAASVPMFLVTAAGLFNDLLALLLSVVALMALVSIVRGNDRWPWALMLVGANTGLLATRVQGLVLLGLYSTTLVLAAALPSNRSRWRRLAALGATAVIVPVLGSSPWWARNYRETGTIVGYRRDFYEDLERSFRSPLEVLTDSEVWQQGLLQFSPGGTILGLALVYVSVAWWIIVRRRSRALSSEDMLLLCLLGAMLLVTSLAFVWYVSVGGSPNPRYLLPALPALAMLAGLGVSNWRRFPVALPYALLASGWVVTGVTSAMAPGVGHPLAAAVLATAAVGVLALSGVRLHLRRPSNRNEPPVRMPLAD